MKDIGRSPHVPPSPQSHIVDPCKRYLITTDSTGNKRKIMTNVTHYYFVNDMERDSHFLFAPVVHYFQLSRKLMVMSHTWGLEFCLKLVLNFENPKELTMVGVKIKVARRMFIDFIACGLHSLLSKLSKVVYKLVQMSHIVFENTLLQIVSTVLTLRHQSPQPLGADMNVKSR